MRIVQTPVRFFPAVGGVEKYVYDLSSELVKRGHEITVVCADEPKSVLTDVQGIHVKRLAYIGKLANTNITPALLVYLFKIDFDLIHTHMPTPWSAECSLIAAKIKRKPCILTYHNDVEKTGLMGFFTRLYNSTVLRFVLSQVDKILITQPRYLKDSAILQPYRSKITVIPNGVSDIPSFDCSARLPNAILFVSVLDAYHRYKGLEYLIRSIALLIEELPKIRLEVVGKGELVSEYQSLVRELHLDEFVCFHGYVEDQVLQILYQKSTVFVLPSIDTHEGFGIVLLEAMSNALPVVTTNAVGLSDEITLHQAGLIVEPKNPEALAEAICRVLSDPEKAAVMGENGRQLVRRNYLWSEICQTLERVYEDVLR